MPTFVSWKPLGEDMLLGIGLDQKHLAEDRDSRNTASYRSRTFHFYNDIEFRDRVHFVVELIQNLQPEGVYGAYQVDKYILRRTVEEAFRSATNHSLTNRTANFEAAVSKMMDSTNTVYGLMYETFKSFLLQQDPHHDDPEFVIEAGRTDSLFGSKLHHQVIGRAALLLRISSGAAWNFMYETGLVLEDIEF